MATIYPVSSVSQLITIGGGLAPKVYGTTKPTRAVHLGVETGAVPDRVTGVLGKGVGRVHGTVQLKGEPSNTPLKRRVRLIRERDGLVYRETWSDAATGAYRFDNVDELETYTVLSYHPTHDRRAVVADNLIPEVMP